MSANLHDDDRPPPEAAAAEVHAKWREWAFWGAMAIGLWAAFQGQSTTAFWFSMVILVVATLKVVAGPVVNEISKTWRS